MNNLIEMLGFDPTTDPEVRALLTKDADVAKKPDKTGASNIKAGFHGLTIVLATLLLCAAAARAQTDEPHERPMVGGLMPASRLAEMCKDDANSAVRGICAGYILGVADSMSISIAASGEFGGWMACFPDQTDALALIRTGKERMKALEPKYAHVGAAGLIGQAMQAAYPCKK